MVVDMMMVDMGLIIPGKIKEDTGREVSPLLIFLDSKGEHSFKPKEEHSYGEIPVVRILFQSNNSGVIIVQNRLLGVTHL